ncbi:MAG: response regulator [Proteobacteria bacterium]|nr:response regulator [Pseudomonadota bacterium]
MLKVLIVEDEFMIADLIEDTLVSEGYAVCGIARTVADAVALGRLHHPDLAVIDLRLAGGGFGSDIAPQWDDAQRVGILYATGNPAYLTPGAVGQGCLTKPYSIHDLLRSLEIVAAVAANGTAAPPFPRGFQLLPQAAPSSEASLGAHSA